MDNTNEHGSAQTLSLFLPYFFDPRHFSSHSEWKVWGKYQDWLIAQTHFTTEDLLTNYFIFHTPESMKLQGFGKKPAITKSSTLKMIETPEVIVSTILMTQS